MNETLAKLGKIGLIPVIKLDSPAEALPLGKALVAGGLPVAEVTFRIGGGDSFGSGLIWGLNNLEGPQKAIEFAAAASALKHTIYGDYNRVTVKDVMALAGGDASGRVQR